MWFWIGTARFRLFLCDSPSTELLRADVHPDVITTALSVTGSILVSTSETDLFEEGLVRSLFTKDPSGIHLSFQYDNIAEKFSSESAFGALEALAKTIWGAVEEKKITLLKKLSNRLGIFYRTSFPLKPLAWTRCAWS